MAAQPVAGLKILIVEDEAIVSFLLEDMLIELGCAEIWLAGGVAQALALLRDKAPDLALLDVSLAGEFAYPVAERLVQLQIPFVFATGYGRKGIASEWQSRPVIQKPFDQETLVLALAEAIGG